LKFLIFLVLYSFLVTPATGVISNELNHDYHTSIADMEYNESTQSYEITLRVFIDDFEKALSKKYNSAVVLDASTYYDEWVSGYILEKFVLTQNSKICQAKWVGKEMDKATDLIWLYFEIPASPALSSTLKNSILLEIFDDQMNVVNFKKASVKKSFLFQYGKTIYEFS